MTGIEAVELGDALKGELAQAKETFRTIRDSIWDGESGDVAAQKVELELNKVKSNYIDLYFDEHKKKRLDITDAQRRGKIQEGRTLLSLRKLRTIDILSVAKLTDLENELSDLKVCYELTPEELKSSPVCPHCHFHMDDNVKPVYGKLENNQIDNLMLLCEEHHHLIDTKPENYSGTFLCTKKAAHESRIRRVTEIQEDASCKIVVFFSNIDSVDVYGDTISFKRAVIRDEMYPKQDEPTGDV